MTTDIDQLLTTWADAERTGDATALDALLTTTSSASDPSG